MNANFALSVFEEIGEFLHETAGSESSISEFFDVVMYFNPDVLRQYSFTSSEFGLARLAVQHLIHTDPTARRYFDFISVSDCCPHAFAWAFEQWQSKNEKKGRPRVSPSAVESAIDILAGPLVYEFSCPSEDR